MAPIELSVNVTVLWTLLDDGKSQIIWIAARVARAVADSGAKIDVQSHLSPNIGTASILHS